MSILHIPSRCVCVCSLCGHYMSRGYRVLETRYPRGSTWHFCPGRFVKKPLTRVSKTRVLLESRVLETRDAIIINSSRNGQLTILLEKHCYLARGFTYINTLTYHLFTKSRSLKPAFPEIDCSRSRLKQDTRTKPRFINRYDLYFSL